MFIEGDSLSGSDLRPMSSMLKEKYQPCFIGSTVKSSVNDPTRSVPVLNVWLAIEARKGFSDSLVAG